MLDTDDVEKLETSLETITAFNGKDLVTRPEWGEIDFVEAEPNIDLVLSIATDLSELPLEYLTVRVAQEIQNVIPDVSKCLKQIDTFSIRDAGDVASTQESIFSGLSGATERFQEIASPHIPYLSFRRGDTSELLDNLNATTANAKQLYEESERWIGEQRDEIT